MSIHYNSYVCMLENITIWSVVRVSSFPCKIINLKMANTAMNNVIKQTRQRHNDIYLNIQRILKKSKGK